MVFIRTFACFTAVLLVLVQSSISGAEPSSPDSARGFAPADAQGNPLNLDFETGTLADWTAEGDPLAFAGQPIEGDTVAARKNMRSRHEGNYWIGGYERHGDAPQGTLTSRPLKVTHPFARFLVGGGSRPSTRVELIRADAKEVIFAVSGDDHEDMRPVAVDLTPHMGREIVIRLVDRSSVGWGHINFDDFRLFNVRPNVPALARTGPPDSFAHEGLSPEDAAKAMTVPEGFKVTLFAGEPDVVQPIAFAFDDRGRLWVAEAYSYPVRLPEEKAEDRILVFEDTDRDGKFDTRKVFAEKLNLVSGIELGFGGVYVGAAPYLLFIPDRNGDDKPDAAPQILLDGWGYQDTHETLNSFAWGPDGWLYGCHGVFTHSRVGKPGTPDAQRVPINAGIWRYHPTRHVFEVFAHGTSNPWGIDWDAHGQAFLTACVIPHLYHVIQGGRYERQAGPHFNPYTYDDIKTIADHRHYLGANPHAGNGKSEQAGGGHAHAGALIYQGGSWAAEYRGSIIMNNIHGARINRDVLEPKGSGFVGHHAADLLVANDRWSQIVSLKSGPDGQVYMIDWYDKNQCHHKSVDVHDRSNGRIFKVSAGGGTPTPGPTAYFHVPDLRSMSTELLVSMQERANDWYSRHILRILQERGKDAETPQAVAKLFLSGSAEVRLRALWIAHVTGVLDAQVAATALKDEDRYIRAWTIQLLCEQGPPAKTWLTRFAALARTDPSPVVRLYLAAALQRLPLEDRRPIASALLAHAEDAADPNLPYMLWFAVEPLAEADPARALALASESRIPMVQSFLARRIAALGTPAAIGLLVDGLRVTSEPALRRAILAGLNEAFRGRRSIAMPRGWSKLSAELARSTDAEVRTQARALSLTFGDPVALTEARERLAGRRASVAERRATLETLLRIHDPGLAATLQGLLDDPGLRGDALRGLAAYDDPATPRLVLGHYAELTPDERRDALNTLAARQESAAALLAALESKQVPARDLSADIVRQIRNHKNPALDEQLVKLWGSVRDTPADKAQLIARFKALLGKRPAEAPDRVVGRGVFARTCQQCHTLFGTGRNVGPDLTGSNRADLDYILANVLDPSALIGNNYQAHVVATSDGRVLTGIISAEDKDAVTLATANETVVIPKKEIEERRASDKSMMPDDLWTPLSEGEIRALVAYLASPTQVPLPAGSEKAGGGK
jgi:putative membrane-bound dehydrogenase-like protein